MSKKPLHQTNTLCPSDRIMPQPSSRLVHHLLNGVIVHIDAQAFHSFLAQRAINSEQKASNNSKFFSLEDRELVSLAYSVCFTLNLPLNLLSLLLHTLSYENQMHPSSDVVRTFSCWLSKKPLLSVSKAKKAWQTASFDELPKTLLINH